MKKIIEIFNRWEEEAEGRGLPAGKCAGIQTGENRKADFKQPEIINETVIQLQSSAGNNKILAEALQQAKQDFYFSIT